MRPLITPYLDRAVCNGPKALREAVERSPGAQRGAGGVAGGVRAEALQQMGAERRANNPQRPLRLTMSTKSSAISHKSVRRFPFICLFR